MTGTGQPPEGQPPAYGQAPQGYGPPPVAPPPMGQPPPAAAPPGYPQPSPYQQSYGGYPSYADWVAATQGPGNGAAVGGFVTSICSIALLITLGGLPGPLTAISSIIGIVVSRKGIQRVDRGETAKQRDLAQWGFWLGVAGLVLSVIATVLWGALFVAADGW